ncbi:ead/Ea22-like family protein [Enterobacter hormaechei]|uniref:ead/Ea22-like family protein n=1 Tax=Enterobacter hormaechei TaxID=158836 RepID=UPI003AB0F30C
MSNIDKRALREAAEKASTDNHTQDEWFHYLRCSTPETVLALLDEMGAKDKRIAELEAREVTLPRPVCTYADHSYPAYSERQVVALLESLGIRINRQD